MNLTNRQNDILNYLKTSGKASIRTLANTFYVSDMTIRRDLISLDRQGYIRRFRGGAVLTDSSEMKHPIQLRAFVNEQEKKKLAELAASFLSDNQLIFLDSSSTCMFLTPYIAAHKGVRVITNSLETLLALSARGVPCAGTGGDFYEPDMCFVGEDATEYLRKLRPNIAFFSSTCCVPSQKLCYDDVISEARVRFVASEMSQKNIFLFDSSKINLTAPYLVCNPERISEIITL